MSASLKLRYASVTALRALNGILLLGKTLEPSHSKNLTILTFTGLQSSWVGFLVMLPYFPTVASTPEPEGWDAAHILQLVNPITGKWSCPTVTKRNRRCEKVVSQERSIKVATMIDSMSVEDAGVIARDHNRELTSLAEKMFCSTHSRAVDSKEKVQAVVAQWRNLIKTSMRQQVQPRQQVSTNMTAPAVDYQPTNGHRGRHFDALPKPKTTAPRAQPKIRDTASDVSSAPQYAPPGGGGPIIDWAAVEEVMKGLQSLSFENSKLQEQNQKLRGENSRLLKEKDEATKLCERTKGLLEAMEDERDTLSEQVDEQFEEINALQDREAEQLETITRLEGALQKTSGSHQRQKKLWLVPPVRPKKEM